MGATQVQDTALGLYNRVLAADVMRELSHGRV